MTGRVRAPLEKTSPAVPTTDDLLSFTNLQKQYTHFSSILFPMAESKEKQEEGRSDDKDERAAADDAMNVDKPKVLLRALASCMRLN